MTPLISQIFSLSSPLPFQNNHMKNEKLINILSAIFLIIGATFSILHLPYGRLIFQLSILIIFIIQSWQVSQLKKRIKELENKS